jgi:alpha-glucosidase
VALLDVEAQPTLVRLHDRRRVIEIAAPLPGVLRVRHAPASLQTNAAHPVLPPKSSYAVCSQAGDLPLVATTTADTTVVSAPGVSLHVDRRAGTFRLQDDQGAVLARSVAVGCEVRAGYPVPVFHSWLGLQAPDGESYLGFGEKVGPLNKRGMRMTFWNTDVLPHHPDTDPLYVSIPFFIGLHDGRAWGCLLDESWRSEVDVAHQDPEVVTWQSAGPELDLYLLSGPTPADVLERYTALTGRTPMPPLWSLGAHQSRWGYSSADEVRTVVEAYRRHDLPLDCVHLDIDHMDRFKVWTWDPARFPEPAQLVSDLRALGVHVVTIVDPALPTEPGFEPYEEAREGGFLVRQDRGDVLVGEVWPRPAVYPDFSRDEVQAWWGDWHRDHITTGVAGFWTDMNEPSCFTVADPGKELRPPTVPRGLTDAKEGPTLPYDAIHGDRRHIEVHNVYGSGMARASFEASRRLRPDRRPFVLTRAAFAGVQRHAALWTGDNSSHFSHLELSISMLLGLGMSGVAFAGADVPGFLGSPTPELLARWTQLGTFYPFARNHSARGTPPKEPWRFGEPWLTLARAALHRRYRLLPTLYTAMHEATQTGLPVMRPLVLHAPADGDALAASDQFLVGRDLLVAPVVRPGQVRRLAYLPQGRWLRLSELDRPEGTDTGPAHVIADAPLERVPMWLRAGGGLALTTPASHTTTANWAHLTWHLHVDDVINARLYEDEGDGDGPSRLSEIRGSRTGGVLRLERQVQGALPPARSSETIVLHGLGTPRAVRGGRLVTREDAVEIEVDAGWASIEVDT